MTPTPFCQSCGGKTLLTERDGIVRPVCVSCRSVTYLDPKLSVGVIVSRGERILLGRRADGAREAGKWSFPAGFVERGEKVEQAAVREVKEEMSIDISIGPLVGLYSEDGDDVVLAVYAANAFDGEPVAGDDMIEAGWYLPDELPALAFPRDVEILQDWRKLLDRQED